MQLKRRSSPIGVRTQNRVLMDLGSAHAHNPNPSKSHTRCVLGTAGAVPTLRWTLSRTQSPACRHSGCSYCCCHSFMGRVRTTAPNKHDSVRLQQVSETPNFQYVLRFHVEEIEFEHSKISSQKSPSVLMCEFKFQYLCIY